MGLCRFRSDYIDGDLGRINMQQEFLKACATQFTELGQIPNLPKVLELLSENLSGNMSAANYAFFVRQLLKCDASNISFHTAPTRPAIIQGYSYAVLELDPWVNMINDRLNPYESEVSAYNLDIVYTNGSDFYSTSYLKGADYYLPSEPQAPITTPAVPTPTIVAVPQFELPEIIFPSPPQPSLSVEHDNEMTIPDSVSNIIVDS